MQNWQTTFDKKFECFENISENKFIFNNIQFSFFYGQTEALRNTISVFFSSIELEHKVL